VFQPRVRVHLAEASVAKRRRGAAPLGNRATLQQLDLSPMVPEIISALELKRREYPEVLKHAALAEAHGDAFAERSRGVPAGWGLLATILLPNAVAVHDTDRDLMDGRAKICREDSNAQNPPSPAETVMSEFRVRCFQPLSRRSGAKNGPIILGGRVAHADIWSPLAGRKDAALPPPHQLHGRAGTGGHRNPVHGRRIRSIPPQATAPIATRWVASDDTLRPLLPHLGADGGALPVV
jgi:hypothetical protein